MPTTKVTDRNRADGRVGWVALRIGGRLPLARSAPKVPIGFAEPSGTPEDAARPIRGAQHRAGERSDGPR